MSSFWEAVDRAALGLSGSAVPRPRSMFEPDAALPVAVDPDGLEDLATQGAGTEPSWNATAAPALPSLPRAEAPPRRGSDPQMAGSVEHRAPAAVPDELTRLPPHATAPSPSGNTAVEIPRDEQNERVLRTIHDTTTVYRVESMQVLTEVTQAATAHETDRGAIGDAPAAPDGGDDDAGDGPDSGEERVAAEPPALPAERRVDEVAEPLSLAPEAGDTPAPLIIEIERIDIRIESERAAPVASDRRQTGTPLSLADYLARRSEAAP